MKYLILFLSFFTTSLSFAQNNPLEDVIKKEINYNWEDYHDFVLKVLPNNPSLAVVAATKFSEKGDDFFNCNLLLLLIDTKTQKIIDRYTEKDEYPSDAYYLSGIDLDMADYKVSDEFRAFGVRVSYSGSSRPNPTGSVDISLYIIRNNKIENVLDSFETYTYQGETDMKCYFDGEESTTILIMDKTKTNGFYNIKAKKSTVILKRRTPKKEDDDCINMDKKLKPTLQTLQYMNGAYHLKKKTRAKK